MADENPPPRGRNWSGAVEDVLDTVAEHEAAAEEVAERQKPKSRGPMLAGALAIFVVVAIWDAWMLTRPPEGLPAESIARDLRYTVQFAVEAVEDFRAEQGRLPTRAEIEDFLDEDVVYAVDGEAFAVTATDDEIQVTYDGSVPLEEWMAADGGGS